MKKMIILIPVAPFEPLSIITKSIESLSKLENPNLDLNLLYIVDCPEGPDERTRHLERKGINHIIRQDTRGRRAGAINDGLATIRRPDRTLDIDFIALFDVDSRPNADFILKCINALENDPDAVIASGSRYITNQDSGWMAKIIAAEYSFFEDIYQLFEKFDGFKQFNGLIGVIDARSFNKTLLNEHVYCEDLEFTQRIYLEGKKPVFADTRVGEQAPTTLKDLYNQRVRWLSGALDGLIENMAYFPHANISINLKLAWFTSLVLPFGAILLTPFIPAYGLRLKSKCQTKIISKTLGLIFHVWLITLCGKVALLNRIRKKRTAWTDSSRSNI